MKLSQQIYGFLYMASLSLSMLIYAKAGTPNWALLLLPLSKRLHSIFMLRLFNDCWATTIMQVSILAFSHEFDLIGCIMFSLALSVKMSILLYSPAVALVLLKRRGLLKSLVYAAIVVSLQVAIARRFIFTFPWEYWRGSFDFSRQFLYKWTVNWKMISEKTFSSPRLAYGLLICHVTSLLIVGHNFWCRPEGGLKGIVSTALKTPREPCSKSKINDSEIVTWFFLCNLIGMTFSRSLHYQFYSWYAYQLPYFVSKGRANLVVKLVCLISIECAWNTFPATWWSSTVLLLCNVFFALTMLAA